MVSRNFTSFFEEDTKARWKIIVIAVLVTAGTGMGADLDGRSLETAEILAATVGGVFFLVCVAVYVWRK